MFCLCKIIMANILMDSAEINDEIVTMDFNHPLADKELHFTGVVIEVREATEEELAHGHVH